MHHTCSPVARRPSPRPPAGGWRCALHGRHPHLPGIVSGTHAARSREHAQAIGADRIIGLFGCVARQPRSLGCGPRDGPGRRGMAGGASWKGVRGWRGRRIARPRPRLADPPGAEYPEGGMALSSRDSLAPDLTV
jgi:hypothetical protein